MISLVVTSYLIHVSGLCPKMGSRHSVLGAGERDRQSQVMGCSRIRSLISL